MDHFPPLLPYGLPRTVAVLVLVGYVVWEIVLRLDRHQRTEFLPQVTKPARQVKPYTPWGIGFTLDLARANMRYDDVKVWLKYFAKAGGWTMELRALSRPTIYTLEPENIGAVLEKQLTDFGKGPESHELLRGFIGKSVFGTDGEYWHQSRQLMRTQFVGDKARQLECFETHMQTLFKMLANGGPLDGEQQAVDPSQGHGRVVDINDLLHRYLFDVTTDFFFEANVKSMTSHGTWPREFHEAFEEAQRSAVISGTFPAPAIARYFTGYAAHLRVIDRVVDPIVDRTLRLTPAELDAKDGGGSFLHHLARFSRDREIVHDQIMAFIAGRDNVASVLIFAIFELTRHPEVLAKLRREILDIVGSEKAPTYDQINNKMPYLDALIHEALRLYPAVPVNIRQALKDTTLPRGGGPDGSEPIAVLKGTAVIYSPYVMHRRPDLYPPVSDTFPDPAIFSPDRWMHWQPKPYAYLPFNGGPRLCLGQQFGLIQSAYILCRLFQRLSRVESHAPPGELPARVTLQLSPAHGFPVAFYQ